jgi:hypothetical protein
MNKQNAIYPHDRILVGNRKEQTTDICNGQVTEASHNRLHTGYMKFPEIGKSIATESIILPRTEKGVIGHWRGDC